MRQGGIWFAFPRLGKDALISNDGAYTPTVEAAVAVPFSAARAEVEVVGVARGVWALRRRPVVAVLTSVVEAAVPAVASSGQEDAIAINFAGELCAFHAIERRPFGCAVVKQLPLLGYCRHTPLAAPLHMCHVILRATDVGAKVVASGIRAVAMDVCTPIVITLLLRFAPSVIPAVFLRLGSPHVTTRPFRARGQTKVNLMRVMSVGAGGFDIVNGCITSGTCQAVSHRIYTIVIISIEGFLVCP